MMIDDIETLKRIEQVRAKLLDLSTSNKMLSYKHPKAGCLRVVDELPEEVFKGIVKGVAFQFAPVPMPSNSEVASWNQLKGSLGTTSSPNITRPEPANWASHLGINASFELPIQSDDFELDDKYTDKNLQTLHYSEELESRLRRLRTAARSAIEETGSNMLYLSFGFLEWTEINGSKNHQAPLILVPVILNSHVQGGHDRIVISWNGDEIQPNLSLAKKLEEFGIILPEIQEDLTIEGYFREVSLRIRGKVGWRLRRYLTLGLFDFGKIVLYNDLDPARWPANSTLASRPLVKSILMASDRNGDQITVYGTDIEDAKRHDLELPLVDRADSSQCIALEAVLAGKNLVIEGPPGTGKSQTITNLIACALYAGKSVLFVAEKLEALDVVRRRLRELGLGVFCLELHSAKTRKASVLEDLSERLVAESQFRTNSKTDAYARLASRREQLAKYLDIVIKPAGSLGINVHQALISAGAARRKIGNDAQVMDAKGLSIASALDVNPIQFFDALSRAERMQKSFSDLGTAGPAQHPWRGVSSRVALPNDADKIAKLAFLWGQKAEQLAHFSDTTWIRINDHLVTSLLPALTKLQSLTDAINYCEQQVTDIEKVLLIKLKRDDKTINSILKLKSTLEACNLEGLEFNDIVFEEEAVSSIEKAISIAKLISINKITISEVFKPHALEMSTVECEDLAVPFSKKGFFVFLSKTYRLASAEWTRIARPKYADAKRVDRIDALSKLAEFVSAHEQLQKNSNLTILKNLIETTEIYSLERILNAAKLVSSLGTALKAKKHTLKSIVNFDLISKFKYQLENLNVSKFEPLLELKLEGEMTSFWKSVLSVDPFKNYASLFGNDENYINWQELIESAEAYFTAKMEFSNAEMRFIDATGLDRSVWFSGGSCADHEFVAFRAFAAANAQDELGAWLAFDQNFSSTKGQIEEGIVNAVVGGSLKSEKLKDYISFALYDSIARACFSNFPDLLQFSRIHLDQLRSEYRNIDSEVMEARRIETAAKLYSRKPFAGVQSGLKSQLTEMAFLKNEMSKKARHRPIRELMRRSGRSIQALKPCFMMGPISAAQYIEPGTLAFDLIVIDEASQMRPEDAIGALARGGQAVIVGDPKQLPPTSFFDRTASLGDQEEDEELTVAEDSKSILDLGSSLFESHMLKFHYRSRHESLIAFSNSRFYRNELVVFPSPQAQSGELGIGWNFIPDGAATSGLNVKEAREVAKFVAKFVKEQPGRSIGVVAMNVKQAQQIENELDILIKNDVELKDRIAALEDMAGGEDFFIKNLERVQGDQRDVIVISMTYGPVSPGGKTPQNFGPINQENGWRRLNVLFTRAKDRMEVFSSMRSFDVVPKNITDSGPDALRAFLEYAETGRLSVKVGPSPVETNEFEDSIQAGLEGFGYKCVPQVGVGSYRIDIAIEDPDRPSTFIAGIECDGATYHSSKSARDRDRIRQEILEGLGWSILRIWSTDWFRMPDAELARVDRELKELLRARRASESLTKVDYESVDQNQTAIETVISMDPQKTSDLDPAKQKSVFSMISNEEARQKLISLREGKLKSLFPDSDPSVGFLRKSMIDELLRKRPLDLDEFRRKISLSLREKTESSQVASLGDEVFEILSHIR